MTAVKDRIVILTDIFLGAAYADRQLAGRERHHITDMVRDLLCATELPDGLNEHIEAFDPDAFDMQAAARNFIEDPPMSRRRLLELVAQLMAADNEYDLAEDEYLRSLARALDVPIAEFADLTLDYEVEALRESFEQLRRCTPPAMPPQAKAPKRS